MCEGKCRKTVPNLEGQHTVCLKEKLKVYTQTSDLDILNEDGFYLGFFLSAAINYCPNLRHIELKLTFC